MPASRWYTLFIFTTKGLRYIHISRKRTMTTAKELQQGRTFLLSNKFRFKFGERFNSLVRRITTVLLFQNRLLEVLNSPRADLSRRHQPQSLA